MISGEKSMDESRYGEDARIKLDQIRENIRIAKLETLLAKSPESMIIGDPYEDPETVQVWVPSTSGTHQSMRRDGYVSDGNNHEVLDVTSYSDDCCVTASEATKADVAWKAGDVLITNADWEENRPALILPGRNAPIEWVGEALSRHFGTAVSLAMPAV
jgi:hypothetical protein